jgi:hypothetical protein
LSVESFGAVCDGVTDDTAALSRAFSTAPAGSTVTVSNTCAHSDVLNVTVPGLTISGAGTLLATDYNHTATQVRASNVTIDGPLLFKFDTTGSPRLGNGWQSMIFLDHAAGTVVRGVTVDGGPGMGILMYGASFYTIDSVTVQGTLADCIHNTNGSHDGTIVNPTLRRCGDDGVAVVSYVRDGSRTHDITVTSPRLYDQVFGRGFTVVGGYNITFTDVYADGSNAAAVYISAEGSYNTYGVDNVKVLGGTLVNSNRGTVDHGAVLVFNGQTNQTIATVDIENLTITDTRISGASQVGVRTVTGGLVSGIQFRNFTIIRGSSSVFATQTGPSAYNTINWLHDGVVLLDHIGFTPYL